MQASPIRIGTRGSPLALVQAREVRRRLIALHGLDETGVEIRVIRTSGDRIQDRNLAEVGGKGLFTKEIEEALSAREIDLAVHSAKDMATRLPDGLAIAAVLEREDVRDAFISLRYASLAEMPPGARLGTSSLRRQALARRARPDIEVVGFRGNVATRLAKLEAGVADATFLAAAGLNRLGSAHRITSLLDVETMPPAPAQGAIAIETRADDWETRKLVAPLDHQPTAICIAAERAFLGRLDGSCRTPIAGLARLEGGELHFDGLVLLPDGSEAHAARSSGPAAAAMSIGNRVAEELISRAGPDFLRKLG